jgi:hypothetical protein
MSLFGGIYVYHEYGPHPHGWSDIFYGCGVSTNSIILAPGHYTPSLFAVLPILLTIFHRMTDPTLDYGARSQSICTR